MTSHTKITSQTLGNETVANAVGFHGDLLTTMKGRKLKWCRHVTDALDLPKQSYNGLFMGTGTQHSSVDRKDFERHSECVCWWGWGGGRREMARDLGARLSDVPTGFRLWNKIFNEVKCRSWHTEEYRHVAKTIFHF